MGKVIREQYIEFCHEYFKTGNGTQSAIKAGYSPKTARQKASQLLTLPDIQEYLQYLKEKTESEKVADLNECLEYITKIIRDENVNTADRLKALDIRLKTLSAYETKLKLTNDTINIVIDGEDDG